MKILVVGPSWVGDMIMTQTLFKALKQNYNATIDVLAPKWSLPVLARIKEVHKAIEMPISHGKLKLLCRYKLGKALRTANYDKAILVPNSWKSALIPYWAKIPLRTGWLGEMRFGLLNDIRYLNKEKYPKMIDKLIALAYPKKYTGQYEVLNPTLNVDNTNTKRVLEALRLTSHNKIMAICPGASYGQAKCWPSTHYAEIIRAKIQEGWQVWLFGSQADKKITDEIATLVNNDPNVINLAGRINLLETIDLLSIVSIVVTNDSGLMHIAAAVNTPIVVVYGSTTPNFTPPLTDKAIILQQDDLPCRPCFKRKCPYGHYLCLTSIKAAEALMAIDKLLNNNITKTNNIINNVLSNEKSDNKTPVT